MVTIIEKRTEKDPLQHIGENAGVCWNADIRDVEKNIKRGKSCMKSRYLV
jgi:thymidylate synthase (FAD)